MRGACAKALVSWIPDELDVFDPGRLEELDELLPPDEAKAAKAELVELFLVTAAGRIADAEAAHKTGDRRALATAAHSLKGMSSMIGATRLQHAAGLIERTAVQSTLDLLEAVTELAPELARLRAAVLATGHASGSSA